MKTLKILSVLALAFAVSAVAHAETQSIKVSGDLTMRAFARHNYDLNRDTDETRYVEQDGLYVSSNWATFLTSTAEVQIDAELTDNVAGVVRLVNQRVWGNRPYVDTQTGKTSLYETNTKNDAFNVVMDLAYIELKEFLYSPVTLRIGRQDLWFGRGYIIGNSLMDPNNTLVPGEYTAINSFDAIRGTMDLDPWTVDVVYAKIGQNGIWSDDDVNLMGLNVGYLFDAYNAEAEAYYWWNRDRRPDPTTGARTNNDAHVLGLRGSFDPVEDWTVALEGAYQGGRYMEDGFAQDNKRVRRAWLLNAMIECRHFQNEFDWKPVMGVEWVWLSGERRPLDADRRGGSRYGGWSPLYPGAFNTAIREFQGSVYAVNPNTTSSATNQHQLLLRGSVEPMDSVVLSAVYANFWLDKKVTMTNGSKHVGQELDLELLWDYTEDVQFGLLAAWFFPGKHLNDAVSEGKAATATSLVGTVKLSF